MSEMRTSGEDWIKEFCCKSDRDITYEKLDVGYAEDVMVGFCHILANIK